MRYKLPVTLADRTFYFIDTSLQWLSTAIKSRPQHMIDIETVEDPNTLVMKDGTLVSAISIEGGTKSVKYDEFVHILDTLERRFGAQMADGSHYFSFYFVSDKDGVRDEIEKVYGGVRKAEQAIGLNLKDIIQEQEDVLAKFCQKERCFILLWSNQKGLSRDEKKLAKKIRLKKNKGMPRAQRSQNLGLGSEAVLARHKAFTGQVMDDFKQLEIHTRLLDSHEYLKEVRMSIDPHETAVNWSPLVPGDKPSMRLPMTFKPDMSDMLWPTMADQLFPRSSNQLDHSTVQIGDLAYAPVTVSLMPKKPEPFGNLFAKLNAEGIPWRMNALVRNDGMSILGMKELAAGFMQYLPGAPENRYIIDVKKDLAAYRDAGETIAQYQLSFATWAPAGNPDLLEERRSKLARIVTSWGECQVAPAEGDPLESTMSSTPGAVLGSIGVAAAAPLYETIKMAPISRQGSPWQRGSQPFRTEDGKILPYQPYSKQQAAWTTLIFGPMGTGKSMFMNNCNLSLILNEDNTELPFISIIDIGPSSRGLISLLRGALPKEKQHWAMYERLKNTEEYAINPLDTRLGLRFPLSTQEAYLNSLLCYLATPKAAGSTFPDGTDGMVTQLIKLAYEKYADRKTQKRYRERVEPVLDKKLKEMGFEIENGTPRWWDVVDFFYKNEMPHEASLAQRYAVPTIPDLANMCKDSRITAIYEKTSVKETGETVPDYVFRKLTEVQSEFPILTLPTKFDLGEARVVSLDLDEVTKGNGDSDKYRTGLMYMIAYYVQTNHFFTGPEHITEMAGEVGTFNVNYRPYHEEFVKSIKRLPKRFCIDEKHRIKGLTQVENQLDVSIREGRKWKVEIMQASQMANDFSEESVNLATNIFILGSGNKQNCKHIKEAFSLSPTMSWHLENSLRPPSSKGATLLSIIQTEEGRFEQFQMSSQGPTFLWACNSSSDDAYVRDQLYRELGEVEARSLLVKLYPAGNLNAEIERRKMSAKLEDADENSLGQDLSNKTLEDEEVPTAILDAIAHDAISLYRTAQMQSKEEKQAAAMRLSA